MFKHIFFDLDDTLTPSRSPMDSAYVPFFERLCLTRDVIVVSGAQESQMRRQLPNRNFTGSYYMLTQNGNHAIDRDEAILWSETFSEKQRSLLLQTIEKWKRELAIKVSDERDLVEDRGSQISYSLIGHEEERVKKAAFDPDGSKRRAILAERQSDTALLHEGGIEVTISGTTCLDFFLLGKNKGYHVARLVGHLGWRKEECLYVGDALEPGRNDETVIGVIPTHAIKNPDDTFDFIKNDLLFS